MPVHLLSHADITAISIVGKGANRKKWFLRKAEGEGSGAAVAIESRRLVKAVDWSAIYCVVAEPGALEVPGMGAAEPDIDDRWASEGEIRKAAHRFMKNGGAITRMHESLEPYGQLVENAVALADFDIDGETILKGSWYIAIEPSAEGRSAIENGTFSGISIEGSATRTLVEKSEDGRRYPASDYAYVPDPQKPASWDLRLTEEPGGEPDPGRVEKAVATLNEDTSQIARKSLSAVRSSVRTAWLKANPDRGRDDLPPVLKETPVPDPKTPEQLQAELEKAQADLAAEQEAKKKADAELEKAQAELDKTPAAELEKLRKDLADKEAELKQAKGEPDVQKQLDETKAELAKIQTEQRTQAFVGKAKTFEKLGDPERIGKLLMAADEHFSEEVKKDFDALLKAAAEQVEKGALFAQLSRTGDEPEGWEDRLAKAAKERVAKSKDLTIEQAKVQIMQEDADLRREYEASVRS